MNKSELDKRIKELDKVIDDEYHRQCTKLYTIIEKEGVSIFCQEGGALAKFNHPRERNELIDKMIKHFIKMSETDKVKFLKEFKKSFF